MTTIGAPTDGDGAVCPPMITSELFVHTLVTLLLASAWFPCRRQGERLIDLRRCHSGTDALSRLCRILVSGGSRELQPQVSPYVVLGDSSAARIQRGEIKLR